MLPTPSNINLVHSLLPHLVSSIPAATLTHRNVRHALAAELSLEQDSFEGKGEGGWREVIKKKVEEILAVSSDEVTAYRRGEERGEGGRGEGEGGGEGREGRRKSS